MSAETSPFLSSDAIAVINQGTTTPRWTNSCIACRYETFGALRLNGAHFRVSTPPRAHPLAFVSVDSVLPFAFAFAILGLDGVD